MCYLVWCSVLTDYLAEILMCPLAVSTFHIYTWENRTVTVYASEWWIKQFAHWYCTYAHFDWFLKILKLTSSHQTSKWLQKPEVCHFRQQASNTSLSFYYNRMFYKVHKMFFGQETTVVSCLLRKGHVCDEHCNRTLEKLSDCYHLTLFREKVYNFNFREIDTLTMKQISLVQSFYLLMTDGENLPGIFSPFHCFYLLHIQTVYKQHTHSVDHNTNSEIQLLYWKLLKVFKKSNELLSFLICTIQLYVSSSL